MKKLLIIIFSVSFIINVNAQDEDKLYNLITQNIYLTYKSKPEYLREKDIAMDLADEIAQNLSNVKCNKQSILYNEAFTNFSEGEVKKALKILDDKLLEQETSAEVYLLKARLNIILLDFIQAEHYYEKALKRISISFEHIIEYGDFCFKQDMLLIAKSIYEEALVKASTEKEQAISNKKLTLLYIKAQQYSFAEETVLKYEKLSKTTINNKKLLKETQVEIHLLKGKIYRGLQDYDKSYNNYLKALNFYHQEFKKNERFASEIANVYEHIAENYLQQDLMQYAISSLETAIDFRKNEVLKNDIENKVRRAELSFRLGVLYKKSGEFASAIELLEYSHEEFAYFASKDPNKYMPQLADIENNIAVVFMELKIYDKSQDFFYNALALFSNLDKSNQLQSKLGRAKVLNNMGNLHRNQLKFKLAKDKYLEALNLYTELDYAISDGGFEIDISMVNNNLGMLYDDMEEYKIAKLYYLKSLETRKKYKEKDKSSELLYAGTLTNLGNLYRKINKIDSSLILLHQSLDIYKKHSSISGLYQSYVASVCNNLGVIYKKIKDFKQADRFYNEAITIRESLSKNNPQYLHGLSDTYNNICLLKISEAEYDRAHEYIDKAIKIREQLVYEYNQVYRNFLAESYENKAYIFVVQENYTQSEVFYKKSLTIRAKLLKENRTQQILKYTQTLQSLCNLYRISRNYKKAIDKSLMLLNLYNELSKNNPHKYLNRVADTKNNLALLYSVTEQTAIAEKYLNEALINYRALAVSRPKQFEADVAMIYNHLGDLYSDHSQYKKAEKNYKQAIELRKKLVKNNLIPKYKLADSYNNLGLLLIDMNKEKDAIRAYSKAIKIYENYESPINNEEIDIKLAMTLMNLAIYHQNKMLKDRDEKQMQKGLSVINQAITLLEKYQLNNNARYYLSYAIQLRGVFNTFSN